MTSDDALVEAATAARVRAYAPYSDFQVGAAVCDDQGRTFGGCNIENASLGLTICAERVALFKARSEGAGRVVRVAIVTDSSPPTAPCGACRQVLLELAPDAQVILANLEGSRTVRQVRDLLPDAFESYRDTP